MIYRANLSGSHSARMSIFSLSSCQNSDNLFVKVLCVGGFGNHGIHFGIHCFPTRQMEPA